MIKSHYVTLARIYINDLSYGHIQKCRYSSLIKNVRLKETTRAANLSFQRVNNSCKLLAGSSDSLSILKRPCQVAGFHCIGGISGVILHCEEVNLQQQRQKSKNKKYSRQTQVEEDSDDSDEDELFELEEGDDFQEVKVRLPSLRLDAVMKAGFNMSRSKAEAAFYGNKVLVNGMKASKKSKQLHEGDDVDLIRGSNAENPDILTISRVTIKVVGDYSSDSDKISVKLRKYPNLLVEKES